MIINTLSCSKRGSLQVKILDDAMTLLNHFSMSQFEAAGKELLEWCGDARAYTSHFENNLMQCLQVVNNVTRTGTVSPDLGKLCNASL